MNFLRMQKEVARFRGELQNDSISGIGSDEVQMIKDTINKTMRSIAGMRPPFLRTSFHIKLRKAIDLVDSSDNPSVTGTPGVPMVTDSETNLNKSNIFCLLTDGDHSYRLTAITAGNYTLDYGTFVTATTATKWTAYAESYPLPHNCGPIIEVWAESGNRPLAYESGTAFRQFHKTLSSAETPNFFTYEAFTNRWGKYSFVQTSVTVNSGENSIDVGATWSAYYDIGNVVDLVTGSTHEYVHTVIGVDESSGLIYLDRNYSGSTRQVNIECNPVKHTKWISFYSVPDSNNNIRIEAYLSPQNMVADTDECIFNDDICWAIIIGALRDDSVSRGFLTEQQNAWYQWAIDEIRKSPTAGIELGYRKGMVLGGNRTFRQGDIQS